MTQTEKGRFVQYPVQLIYARKDLTRDDKWVLLAIMGTCWTDGPHRLSYRQIEALSGVPVSLLSSYTDKKTGKHHEGIIDRLARAGDIRVEQRKEVDSLTGKTRGQPQSYIYVNYSHIWQENVSYCGENQSVSYTNTSVLHTNESVSHTNESVSHTNESVSVSRSELPPNITKIDQINTDKEDRVDRSTDANASRPTDSSLQEIHVDKSQTDDTGLGSHSSYSQQKEQVAIGAKQSSKKVTQASSSKPVLTPDQQAVWEEWCKMPWFMGVAPALERNDPEHLQRLSVYKPTQESMLKVMNWARSKEVDRNGWYKGKKWKLYALAKEYPEWASLQFTEEPIQLSEARSALDERSARNLEKLKAKGAAKHAAQSPPLAQSATA